MAMGDQGSRGTKVQCGLIQKWLKNLMLINANGQRLPFGWPRQIATVFVMFIFILKITSQYFSFESSYKKVREEIKIWMIQ